MINSSIDALLLVFSVLIVCRLAAPAIEYTGNEASLSPPSVGHKMAAMVMTTNAVTKDKRTQEIASDAPFQTAELGDGSAAALFKLFGSKMVVSNNFERGASAAIPAQMWRLYEEMASSSTKMAAGKNENFERVLSSARGTTVRSFFPKDLSMNDADVVTSSSTSAELFFDVTTLPSKETLIASKLHLRRYLASNSDASCTGSDDVTSDDVMISKCAMTSNDGQTIVEIHLVLSPASLDGGVEAITRLIDTRALQSCDDARRRSLDEDVVTSERNEETEEKEEEAWETFDVSDAVRHWLRHPERNHGLRVILRAGDATKQPVTSLRHHVRLKRRDAGDTDLGRSASWPRQQPVLLTFSRDVTLSHDVTSRDVTSDDVTSDDVTYTNDARKRQRRAASPSVKKARPRRNQGGGRGGVMWATAPAVNNRRRPKDSLCRRREMKVVFKDLGWKDWIRAPESYNAYQCSGECPDALADHMNATNHAIVQTLVNSLDPRLAPKPCCVPTELSPIALLYVDEYDKVVLKTYPDMIVEACGCR